MSRTIKPTATPEHFDKAAHLYASLGFSTDRAAHILARTGVSLDEIRKHFGSALSADTVNAITQKQSATANENKRGRGLAPASQLLSILPRVTARPDSPTHRPP